MAAYKDKDRNTWYVKFYFTNYQGERKPKMKRGFLTRKDALNWEREFLLQQEADLDMKFKQFIKVYREDKKSRIKESTWDSKNRVIDQKLIPWFGEMPMNQIKSSDILKWQNEMIAQGLADSYLRMIQNQLTAIFNHADRYYELRKNPCKKVDKMGSPKSSDLTFWTLEEFLIFIEGIKDKPLYYMLFKVLFWTGMRVGEVLALTPKDIDFIENTISISKTYYRKYKKDHITSPKTPKSNRVVTVPSFLMVELEHYIKGIYGLEDDNRIFGITQRPIQKWIVDTAKKAGVKRIRVHDLRHSHVALLIQMGVSPVAISERVGHESVTTTLNIYGHLYPTVQGEIANLLNEKEMETKNPLHLQM